MIKTVRFALVPSLLALACASSFALSSTSTTNLGTLGTDATYIGNSFNQAQSFTDFYTFHINGASSVGGMVTDYNANIYFRDVNISTLQLLSGGASLVTISNVPNTYNFTFANLVAGDYTLKVTGDVVNGMFSSTRDTASYDGYISATPSVASGAPEASEALMAAMGLVGVGFWARARKSAK
jgi:hypothetical protein